MKQEIVLRIGIGHVAFGTGSGVALLLLLGALAPGPDSIRVQHIDIVDAEGHTTMSIGPTADGRCGLFIMGKDGEIRAAMQMFGAGEESGIAVFGRDRSNFVALTAKDVDGEGTSAVTVNSDFGWAVVTSSKPAMVGFNAQRKAPARGGVNLSVLGTGDAGLSIIDDRGRERGMSADGDR